MVVAMIALFVALGGGAYAGAGAVLGPNTVGHTQIKKAAVRSSEIRNGTIRHFDVRNNTLLSRDIHDGTLEYKDFAKLPAVRVYKDSNTTIPQAEVTRLEFNRERFDTHKLHSDSEPARLVARYSGLYMITGQVSWNSTSGGGQRVVFVKPNGTPTSRRWRTSRTPHRR